MGVFCRYIFTRPAIHSSLNIITKLCMRGMLGAPVILKDYPYSELHRRFSANLMLVIRCHYVAQHGENASWINVPWREQRTDKEADLGRGH